MTGSPTERNKKTTPSQNAMAARRVIRQVLIYLISLGIVVGSISTVINVVYSRYFRPVDVHDNTPIDVEVPMGTSVNGIANILYQHNLIKSTAVFKLMVDFSNKNNKMQAGKYRLSKDMTMQAMIDELLTGRITVSTKSITLREGEDIRQIASRLVNDYKMSFTEQDFIQAAKNISAFLPEFPFLQDIPKERLDSDFPLEGYLFPNTYYVFSDDKPNNIIRVLLRQFERTYNEEMRDKAKAMGMTMDEVVTLASIIQNEGKVEEFTKISAVFHNRLNIDMKLESCATVNYVLVKEVRQTNLTLEDTRVDSPYNTYMYEGLPVGPISSPGKAALLAALNPYEEFMTPDKPMLYFVLMDPEIGHHAFNSTYQGHVNDKNKWQKLWN